MLEEKGRDGAAAATANAAAALRCAVLCFALLRVPVKDMM